MFSKKSNFLLASLITIAAVSMLTLSCNKKFDEPPGYIPPTLTPTMTIADLRAMHSSGNIESLTSDDIIEGVVVANDSSGNFYKQIAIEDATGGLMVLINDYSLYTSFPIGRKIYINLNGLYLGDYNGLIQLGGGIDNTGAMTFIAPELVDTYIIKGEFNQPITPIVVSSISSLDDSYQSRLIELDGFEFSAADTSKTYADAVNKLSVNYTLKDCSGQSITLRTSGYSSFAAENVPNGNGTIYAIYSVFGSTKQIIIRDPNDVQFGGDRCTGGGGGGGDNLFFEDFTSVVKDADIALSGWVNVAESGTKNFVGGTFSSNNFAKITAYKSTFSTMKSWLVTPGINLSGGTNPKFNFTTVDGYDNGATLKVYISTNYNGNSTPWTSTWTELAVTISSGHTTGYAPAFVPSGDIDLSAYSGTVYFAFVYEGSDPSKTTTFEVDDVTVTKN